jgi:hypothetical protein
MKVDKLKDEPTVKMWLSFIRASDNTKLSYIAGMQEYTEFIIKVR